jgi:hypothetical protein
MFVRRHLSENTINTASQFLHSRNTEPSERNDITIICETVH